MDSMTPETLSKVMNDAVKLAEELVFGQKPVPAKDISHSFPSETGGVYLIGRISENERRFIWVGQTKNLRRAICNRHMKRGPSKTGGDYIDKFRRSEGLRSEQEALKRLLEIGWFAWKEIDHHDMRILVESLLIAWLRAEKHQLLNHPAPPRPIDIPAVMAGLRAKFPKDSEEA
jgi:hypothetical protein